MDENEEAINLAKLYYFTNQIIYRSSQVERDVRFSNDFLEYLRHSVADSIEFENSGGKQTINIT